MLDNESIELLVVDKAELTPVTNWLFTTVDNEAIELRSSAIAVLLDADND